MRSSTSLTSSVTGERKVTAFTLVSPSKEPASVGGGDPGDLGRAFRVDFCYSISNVQNVRGFVPFFTNRNRGQKGRIRLDQQPIQRQLADDFALFFGIFVGD